MGDGRTLKEIYRKLVSNPFFPLLFIAEAIKTAAVTFTAVEPVVAYTVLAVVATVLWAASDAIDVDFDKESFVGK